MTDAGYVRIYRALLGHPAFRNDGEAMAFAWMVIRASWRDTRVRYKGQGVELRRGELAVSVRDLAEALDRPKGWIERLLKRLKNETMIETQAKTGVNVITICNYDDFQADQDSGRTPDGTRDRTDAGQTQDTEQRREEYKKEDSPPTPPRGTNGPTALKEDWTPPAIEDLPPEARACAQQWPSGAYQRQAGEFRTYWLGTGKKRKDWRMTFANRVLSQHERVMRDARFGTGPPGRGSTPSYLDHKISERANHQ